MSQKILRICILENGVTPDDLIDQFGSYPMMIENWLAPFLPEATFTYLSPVQGEALPAPQAFDGYILSGSKYSTYERSPWMLALIEFLQQLREERCPVFGICFGHQIMADAYGGLNAKSAAGWASARSSTSTKPQNSLAALPPSYSIRIRFSNARLMRDESAAPHIARMAFLPTHSPPYPCSTTPSSPLNTPRPWPVNSAEVFFPRQYPCAPWSPSTHSRSTPAL